MINIIRFVGKFWNKNIRIPVTGKVIFFTAGIASTLWFLIRVIPKPQRASYPCMRAAAPMMSGFVIYLLTLTGTWIAFSDQYLIESALANNPPSKTLYDPEKDGSRCKSLGVMEHWNNAVDKKYSRNLGKKSGIELIQKSIE